MNRVMVIIVVLVMGTVAKAGVDAGPIVNPANGHSYYLLSNQNWINSEAEAVQLGGHLITINDADENAWMVATFSNYGDVPHSLWIGFTDMQTEGDWVWTSGEPVTYTNWGGGEPNNMNNEDFTSVTPNGGWTDVQNGLVHINYLHGVVEIVPEPATFSIIALGGLALLRRRRL